MFTLKGYQLRAIDALEKYFEDCIKLNNSNMAFYKNTLENFGVGIPYNEVKELPGLPYVCLRVPTGGGKTVMACKSIPVISSELLRTERPLVLWVVPTNTIREQTIGALKNVDHPYRMVLREDLPNIEILNLQDALRMQPSLLDTNAVIIVTTMAALRVEDTDGRKIYEESGDLMSHFSGVLPSDLDLDRNDDGKPIYSLSNVLKKRRPIIIVDEAHNARTELSFSTLARFNPCTILELTATPATKGSPSNVLYSVSAAELKSESMIKNPILLETKHEWRELLTDAIATRKRLEELAINERQYRNEIIRPIVLIQAQPKRKDEVTITVDTVRECLIKDYRIPSNQIARATSEVDELENVDIQSKDCEIRYVITVQALREGWDCPNAYVLCSIGELRSSTAVEQILGRLMRLPYANKKNHSELNKAYAFSASKNFIDAANALRDSLIQNGFEKQEASEMIVSYQAQQSVRQGTPQAAKPFTFFVPEVQSRENVSHLDCNDIIIDKEAGTVTIMPDVDDAQFNKLLIELQDDESKKVAIEAYNKLHETAPQDIIPSKNKPRLTIPLLSIRQGRLIESFEETHFMDRPWSLHEKDASLTTDEYDGKRAEGQVGEVAISDDGKLVTNFVKRLQGQVDYFSVEKDWKISNLVYWLDSTIPHSDLSADDAGVFITRIINLLIEDRGFSLNQLVTDKYKLRESIKDKINKYRNLERKASYQSLILPESPTPLIVSPQNCFQFDLEDYPYNFKYVGHYLFKKHYYEVVGDLKSAGEEFECAQFIDTNDQIITWVRNLERRPKSSFWLQTSEDRFYPDFVCLLKDGRYLVIEYKGENLWSNDDSKEKRILGELWAERSNGKCLFVMPKGRDLDEINRIINK